MDKVKRQFGTWSSPVSSKLIANTRRLNDAQWDTSSDILVWVEGHGKRGVLMAQKGDDAPRELNDLSVRGHVGYGGGEFTVFDGTVYFSTGDRLYKQSLEAGQPKAITPAFGGFASPRVSHDGKWLAYVHTYEGTDGIALIDTDGKHWARKLAFGTDFVMQPAWHPHNTHLAYIVWNHPNMPWDGTELRLMTLSHDPMGIPYAESIETLIGDEMTSIYQPEFSPDGRYLAYISNKTDYGQIYLYDLTQKTHTVITESEIGKTTEHGKPAWVQGGRVYGWARDGQSLYFLRNQEGMFSLWQYDLTNQQESHITGLENYTHLDQIAVSTYEHNPSIAFLASSTQIPPRVASYAFNTVKPPRVHARSNGETIPEAQFSKAEAISWAGDDGDSVYGLYFPPTSNRFEGLGKPPLMVMIHGGPTSQTTATFDARTQFFATRGFAVLQVNHRGSTGYGKAYMNKLRGMWGVYDVEDGVSGAQHLIDTGQVDADKIVIMGSSAGGYTVLQSLVNKPNFYKAGVCMYGISNQFMLVQDTHKFEAKYNDSLIGALPEASAIYRERSPYFQMDNIIDPMIILQGERDNVVPKNQSDSVVQSLRKRGIPHEYHVYEGEGHGFRKPETIDHYLTAIMNFLTQHVIYT